jgi:hypothetical protein
MTPELKQFGDLSASDFERHPIWVSVHGQDEGEPWYDEADEETFRPWTGDVPVNASEGMLLVRATLELRDGSSHHGFATPAFDGDGLGTQQPQIFVGGQLFGFWGGIIGVPSERRQALYEALGKSSEDVFPLRFSIHPALATGVTSGVVEGFYKRIKRELAIER